MAGTALSKEDWKLLEGIRANRIITTEKHIATEPGATSVS
jgi:hypothetical protein